MTHLADGSNIASGAAAHLPHCCFTWFPFCPPLSLKLHPSWAICSSQRNARLSRAPPCLPFSLLLVATPHPAPPRALPPSPPLLTPSPPPLTPRPPPLTPSPTPLTHDIGRPLISLPDPPTVDSNPGCHKASSLSLHQNGSPSALCIRKVGLSFASTSRALSIKLPVAFEGSP